MLHWCTLRVKLASPFIADCTSSWVERCSPIKIIQRVPEGHCAGEPTSLSALPPRLFQDALGGHFWGILILSYLRWPSSRRTLAIRFPPPIRLMFSMSRSPRFGNVWARLTQRFHPLWAGIAVAVAQRAFHRQAAIGALSSQALQVKSMCHTS